MRRGDVYLPQKIEQALKHFFRRGNLIALRELALRQVAEQVDRSLESYMEAEDIRKNWAVRERIAVCVSSNPAAQYLVARAARMARRLDAELYVVHVNEPVDDTPANQKTLAANLQFAQNLRARVVRLDDGDVADAIGAFVRERHITQVIFGRSVVHGWRKWLYVSSLYKFLRESPEVDIHVVTQEQD
jgi:two-component system sensor histidine kinase KdpD